MSWADRGRRQIEKSLVRQVDKSGDYDEEEDENAQEEAIRVFGEAMHEEVKEVHV